MLVYRLTLHPLARYPGPALAACTDWYNVYWLASGSRHLELDRQHKQYGECSHYSSTLPWPTLTITKGKVVRFGPNRISVCSAGGSHDLGSVKANVLRSPVFSSFRRFFGVDSSATTLNPKEHAFRRRVNNQAMVPGVLQNYADRVTPHVTFMINKFKDSIHAVGKEGSLGGEVGWSSPINFTRE